MVRRCETAFFLLFSLAVSVAAVAEPTDSNKDRRFEIVYSAAVDPGPLTGRAYVIISRSNEKEARSQVGRTGVPFFGHDFDRLAAETPVFVDGNDPGYPLASLKELPAGDYFVQGFINVYSEFKRSDGHTVWMHDDQWDGQHWRISPGNLYSEPVKVHFDSEAEFSHRLVLDQKIPPIELPQDTEWVKRFRFQSPKLSEFWGRPIYLGATVLLPKNYERETMSYPVVYYQGHFSIKDPMNWKVGGDFMTRGQPMRSLGCSSSRFRIQRPTLTRRTR